MPKINERPVHVNTVNYVFIPAKCGSRVAADDFQNKTAGLSLAPAVKDDLFAG